MPLTTEMPVSRFTALTGYFHQRPAVLALLIQICALMTLWLVLQVYAALGLHQLLALQPTMLMLVLGQGAIASLYAYQWQMPSWWLRIHLLFPLVCYGMWSFELNNGVYLVGLCFTALLYWTVFQTRVPFYPSKPKVWRAVHQLIVKQAHDTNVNIIEIGSGLGDFSMYLAQQSKQYQVLGIEIAPLPWLVSRCRAKLKGSAALFKLGNYDYINFAKHDVVFAYLSPAAMPALWQKAAAEMQPGSMLISLEFDIPNAPAAEVLHFSPSDPKLYIWRF